MRMLKGSFLLNKSFGHRSVKGFTLVEVLVSLLLLSVGLLVIAAMQIKTLQSMQVSYFHTLASIAAQDAVERLRILTKRSEDEGTVLCYEIEDILADNVVFESSWTEVWGGSLPGLSVSDLSDESCLYTLLVEWEESRLISEGSSSLTYHAKIPELEYLEDEKI